MQVCALALEGAGWEADAALALLRGFQTDQAPALAALQQVRQTSAIFLYHRTWKPKQHVRAAAGLPDRPGARAGGPAAVIVLMERDAVENLAALMARPHTDQGGHPAAGAVLMHGSAGVSATTLS